mmetsp:Transcript_95339/g.308894  ORF Transcript_95339/g.308894 Transcript_95339/m.308894 type:complete len:216 (+) Transcript_95339:592-1239(+)
MWSGVERCLSAALTSAPFAKRSDARGACLPSCTAAEWRGVSLKMQLRASTPTLLPRTKCWVVFSKLRSTELCSKLLPSKFARRPKEEVSANDFLSPRADNGMVLAPVPDEKLRGAPVAVPPHVDESFPSPVSPRADGNLVGTEPIPNNTAPTQALMPPQRRTSGLMPSNSFSVACPGFCEESADKRFMIASRCPSSTSKPAPLKRRTARTSTGTE